MKIVMLDRNSVGMDMDVSIYERLGHFEAHDVADRESCKEWIKDVALARCIYQMKAFAPALALTKSPLTCVVIGAKRCPCAIFVIVYSCLLLLGFMISKGALIVCARTASTRATLANCVFTMAVVLSKKAPLTFRPSLIKQYNGAI